MRGSFEKTPSVSWFFFAKEGHTPMDFYPLTLSVKPGNWRLFNLRRTDPRFYALRDKVLIRDDYMCRFCGFQAAEYQEVINLDHNYHNNVLSNLVTSCCFCSQCFFLESVGMGDYGGGTLIYWDALSQAELNGLCHVLFCAISNGTSYKTNAQNIYRSLKLRSQPIVDKFGEGANNPAVFGQLLLDARTIEPNKQQEVLSHLRLLPSRAKYKAQIETWARAALAELPES